MCEEEKPLSGFVFIYRSFLLGVNVQCSNSSLSSVDRTLDVTLIGDMKWNLVFFFPLLVLVLMLGVKVHCAISSASFFLSRASRRCPQIALSFARKAQRCWRLAMSCLVFCLEPLTMLFEFFDTAGWNVKLCLMV